MVRSLSRLQAKSLAALLGVGVLILAACSSSSPTQPPTQPAATSTDIRTPGNTTEPGSDSHLALDAIVANLPLDFPIRAYQGETFSEGTTLNLSDFVANGKPVVLNFWAGLCPPCRAEMPDLELFHDEFKDDVTLIGVDIGQYLGLGNQTDARDLLNELGVTYPAGFTENAGVIRGFDVFGMPTTVFITSKGEVFRQWGGLLNREVLADISNEMLALESG